MLIQFPHIFLRVFPLFRFEGAVISNDFFSISSTARRSSLLRKNVLSFSQFRNFPARVWIFKFPASQHLPLLHVLPFLLPFYSSNHWVKNSARRMSDIFQIEFSLNRFPSCQYFLPLSLRTSSCLSLICICFDQSTAFLWWLPILYPDFALFFFSLL